MPVPHADSPIPNLFEGRALRSTLHVGGLCVAVAMALTGCGGEPTGDQPAQSAEQPEGEGTAGGPAVEGGEAEDGGIEDGGPEDGGESAGVPKRIFAARFVVNVRERPAETSTRIGRLRAGAVLNAKTSAPVGYDDCPAGWYELETGGFVCNRREVTAFDGPRLPEARFRQPRLTDPLPYEYGYIRSDVPVYRRPPNDEEAAEHEGWRAPNAEPAEGDGAAEGAAAARPAGTVAATETAGRPAGGTPGPAGEGAAPAGDGASGMVAAMTDMSAASGTNPAASPTATPRPAGTPAVAIAAAPAAAGDDAAEEEAPPEPITLDSLRGEGVVHHRAMRGFWVSLDRRIRSGPRRYWRTQAAGFVPARAVATRQGSTFAGLALDENTTLPVGFISRRQGTNAETMDPERGRLRRARRAYHRDSFAIAREETVGNRRYYVTADGLYYRADVVMRVDRVEREERIPEGVKWIEVNLENQTLVAYDGERPAYVTLISSGRVKRRGDEELDHHTPSGVFRIREKHITNTMDGDGTVVDGPYSIEDVPYVQYFWRSYAFHTAFWHDNFGRTKSHGCINMSPLDSRWLFNWTTPGLPANWHSIWAPEGEADTTPTYVWVHGETPQG